MKFKDLRAAASDYAREIFGIVGLGLVAFGVWNIYPPAGEIVLGVEFCGVACLFALTEERES